MSFLKEYNSLIKRYKRGIDYVDYKVDGYLIFIPLCRNVLTIFLYMNTPAFRRKIRRHNCIIIQSKDALLPGCKEPYYKNYVMDLFEDFGYYKAFVINVRKINYISRATIAFTSINFKYENDKPVISNQIYDGTGHYYNLGKIYKSKYFKDCIATWMTEEIKQYYQVDFKPLIERLLEKLYIAVDKKFEYEIKC